MTDPPDAAWPESLEELEALQRVLGRMQTESLSVKRPESLRVAGCYVCTAKGKVGIGSAGEPAHAAAVVEENGVIHDPIVIAAETGAPFVSGALALREGPLLERAVRALVPPPDVLLVNATGRDHPRRAGLALHLGWMVGVASIGVTQRTLIASGSLPETTAGATSPLYIDGELVGAWLRTRANARPVAVSAGYRTDVDGSVAIVRASTRGSRTPEPIRRAREAARRARAGQAA